MAGERRVRGAGLSLRVSEYGDPGKTTVVLLHGFPDTSGVWGPLVQLLATDLHVVTYDVRGAGRSDAPEDRGGYALGLLVDDLAAVVDAVSPDAPVHLVAHDWGSIQGWDGVTTKEIAHRFASYTSVSGPPLDHAGLWARRRRTTRPADLLAAARQALHSWYIAYFHLPFVPELMGRWSGFATAFSRTLHRIEHAPTDDQWPAPTFGQDFAHGVELYRANVRGRMRHPQARHTDVPVQLVVPTGDRFVTPSLLDGLEEWTSLMWRREIPAGHWVIRTHPDVIASWVREVIASVETGSEADGLQRARVA